MVTKSEKFRITVPVKPYIRQFLETNYGSPVDFSHFPEENLFFTNLLRKPSKRHNCKYPGHLKLHSEIVEVLINQDVFYRHGWELTKTDIVAFGKHHEQKVKFFMRMMVGTYHAVGLPYKESITKFQERFDYLNEIWPSDSIKKDFYRNGHTDILDFKEDIFNKLEKIILANLYNHGTVSRNLLMKHENN